VSIVELEDRIGALPAEARAAAERIYAVSTTIGTLVAPDEMRPWIEKLFGSVGAVTRQRIVRVTDRVTLEGALFNDLRARRPMSVPEKSGVEVAETIASSENDPFCHPLTGTPADDFGRISGAFGVTASNVAKYDGYHGVLVFTSHDPLAPMDAAAITDHFATARTWAEAAFGRDPAAPYYFLMWNCLWRAGGSIVHGHMQMTTTRGMHYPKVERLRQAERFDERADLGRQDSDGVHPVSLGDHILCKTASPPGQTIVAGLRAQVVAVSDAVFALSTSNKRLERDSVPDRQSGHVLADLVDDTRKFVAQYDWHRLSGQGVGMAGRRAKYGAVFELVEVGPADAGPLHFDLDSSWLHRGHRDVFNAQIVLTVITHGLHGKMSPLTYDDSSDSCSAAAG